MTARHAYLRSAPQICACTLLAIAAAFATAHSASAADAPPPPASARSIPAGDYVLDKAHSSFVFQLSHLGFSRFTARFTRFDAELAFDPAQLSAARIEATIDPRSISSDNAPTGFLESLPSAKWLDAAQFGTMSFRSTEVLVIGPQRVRVTGDFKLHGVTKPVALLVTFNGGYADHPVDPNARIGFSATSTLKRSDFGIALGIPAPGTTLGVGDEIEIALQAEFTSPPLPAAAASAASAASK